MKVNGAERGHNPPSAERLSDSVVNTVHHWTINKMHTDPAHRARYKNLPYSRAYRQIFAIELDRIMESIEEAGNKWMEINREG